MFERQGIVSSECLEVCGHEVVGQDGFSVPLCDKAVVEGLSGMAQSEQRLGVAILLQQDIIDRWKTILQVPERIDVRADPLSDIDNGPRILDDSPQLRRDDLVDDRIDQPDPPAEPIEDGPPAHPGGRGNLVERRREAPLPEHLNRRVEDPSDVSAGNRAESGRTTGIGHDAVAAILTDDDPHEGPIDLTLPNPVTLADFAASVSEITGRRIKRVVVDDETWVADATASGASKAVARFTLSMLQATRSGHFSGSDPTLMRLLERRPRSIIDQLKELVVQ